AHQALSAGLHVFLFSDGVSLDDEVALKRRARDRRRLVMGPECGTAIINGIGLGFANRVRRGPIGVVGASGTGIQELTSLIHRLGSGVSHAIGTGGRDLHAAVGGLTTLQGVAALGADPDTRVVLIVSKPPSPAVADAVLRAAVETGKPVVACLLGYDGATPAGVRTAPTLEEAATTAVKLTDGSVRDLERSRGKAPGARGAGAAPRARTGGRRSRGRYRPGPAGCRAPGGRAPEARRDRLRQQPDGGRGGAGDRRGTRCRLRPTSSAIRSGPSSPVPRSSPRPLALRAFPSHGSTGGLRRRRATSARSGAMRSTPPIASRSIASSPPIKFWSTCARRTRWCRA